MKAGMSLLLLFALSFFAWSSVATIASSSQFNGSGNASMLNQSLCQQIEFEAADELILPRLKLSGKDDLAFLSRLPVFFANQSIKGTICNPAGQSSRSGVSVCISPFGISDFASVLSGYGNYSEGNCREFRAGDQLTENGSGSAEFLFPPAASGMYAVYITSLSGSNASANGTQSAALPLLVTEGDLMLSMPDRIASEDQFISIELNSTFADNESKFYAAVMMLEGDYRNASLSMSDNDTKDCTDLVLSLSGKTMSLPCPFRLSSEILMNMLPLLPENSAVGLVQSSEPKSSIMLLNDRLWTKGSYIITCCAYSQERGLLGVKQGRIQVI